VDEEMGKYLCWLSSQHYSLSHTEKQKHNEGMNEALNFEAKITTTELRFLFIEKNFRNCQGAFFLLLLSLSLLFRAELFLLCFFVG
jgi:hypothetical protein